MFFYMYNIEHKIPQTYEKTIFRSLTKIKELGSNWMKDANNVIWAIYSWNPNVFRDRGNVRAIHFDSSVFT
jgi:hypothetical protein